MVDDGHVVSCSIRLGVDAHLAVIVRCDECAGGDHPVEVAPTVVVLWRCRFGELLRFERIVLNGEVRVCVHVLVFAFLVADSAVGEPLTPQIKTLPKAAACLHASGSGELVRRI